MSAAALSTWLGPSPRFQPISPPLLSLLVWIPAAGSALAFLSGKPIGRGFRFAAAAAPIAIAVLGPAPVTHPWIPSIGASYELAVDGLSILLCVLISLLALLALALEPVDRRNATLVLWTQSALLGLLCSRDALLLMVFLGVAMTCLMVREGHRFFSIQWVGFALLSGFFVLCYQLAAAQTGFPTSSIDRFESLVAFPNFAGRAFLLGAAGPVIMMFGSWTKGSNLSLAGYSVVPAYLLLRFVSCVFPMGASEHAPLMIALGLLGIASAALSPRTRLIHGYYGLLLLGMFSFRFQGVVAAQIEMIHLGLALAAVALCSTAKTRLEALLSGVVMLVPPGASGLIRALPRELLVVAGLGYVWWVLRFLRSRSRHSEMPFSGRAPLIILTGLWVALVASRPALSVMLSDSAEKITHARETSEEP
ncbi:MAG TPA: hypothetical protein VLK65_23955 [Vicinamibacteria bacterium]|nr:hypothetical protein [Vicinamibacteria bacterium]